MKKKVAVLMLAGALIGSSVTYAATSNYYADLVLNQKEQIQKELDKTYIDKHNEMSKQVHNDMVMKASTSRDEMVDRLHKYMDQQIRTEQQKRMNSHTSAIDSAAKQLESELKQYIDDMIAHSSYLIDHHN